MRVTRTVKASTSIDGESRHHPPEAGVNTNQRRIPLQAQFSRTLLIAEKSAITVILQAESEKSCRLSRA
ncbi:hypothetical protein CUN67_02440 [Pantoea cypripedii]|uniref:Uncharacterized protein n=1 Tax=Pantoea cypripedii TaxID=55209 RepID=A0A6B9FWJ9_PANCY|nr:hypothetical protein CUN67_02440 [Pantoea cypripedii]